jgi:hypothetical protein
MNAGLVDVRTRDNVRHGKMRVDALGKHLETLKPAHSKCHEIFYSDIWCADKYPEAEQIASLVKEAVVETKMEEKKDE